MQSKTFNVYKQENQAVQDAYAMLVANIHLNNDGQKKKSFVITSCMPGVGKTSIAISLAMTMATSGWKVLLVDADMRRPTSAKRLNSDEIFGLSDFLSGTVELSGAICSTNIENLTYLSCGKSSNNPNSMFCTARFNEWIESVKKEFDYILFDTPALASVIDASLIAAKADGTLFIVEIDQTTVVSMKPAIEQLKKVNANIVGVILNKVKKKEYMRYFEYFNYFRKSKIFRKKAKKRGTKEVFVVQVNDL